MLNDDPHPHDANRQHELDSLRRRMLRDLENFLSQAMHQPSRRLQAKVPSKPLPQPPQPHWPKRYTLLSLN
ncbi:hypothetical protein [Fontivita pretiosa]|uniref:hypothetical protein n=1 Tax=Fontivita pretiosa TaxID=2989684 RepID=UPI003D170D0D